MKLCELVPLQDFVVLKQIVDQASPIVMPDNAKASMRRWCILAAGPGRMLESGQREDMNLFAGDLVKFASAQVAMLDIMTEDAGRVCLCRGSDIAAKAGYMLPKDAIAHSAEPMHQAVLKLV